jgi:hypothetical protein
MCSARLLQVECFAILAVLATDVTVAHDVLCPTTASSAPPQFLAPAPYSAHAPSQRHFWYGTDALWTMLRGDGRWGALYLPDQGVYRNKVFVWRKGYDPRTERTPALTLTAWRLDGSAPPVVVTGATHASAADIGSAMLTAANLPAAGCWELTAHYGLQTLTFVVSVP